MAKKMIKNTDPKQDLEKVIQDLKANSSKVKKSHLRAILKKYKKEILISNGALIWLLDHIDGIKEVVEILSGLFKSPMERILDMDNLTLFDESFIDLFETDKELYLLLGKKIAASHNFQSIYSRHYDLYIVI